MLSLGASLPFVVYLLEFWINDLAWRDDNDLEIIGLVKTLNSSLS